MKNIQPHEPSQVSPYARACLDALLTADLAERISLGGAFGLFHYIDYRSTYDVVSIELSQDDKTVFSFQIAARTAILEEPISAGWIDFPLDSLSDLAASKMVALVERGAPRDFLDIYTLCQAELLRIEECWLLWRRRQILSGSDVDLTRARLAIETHLERISLHRPLEKIADIEQRQHARQLREWFTNDFIQVKDE